MAAAHTGTDAQKDERQRFQLPPRVVETARALNGKRITIKDRADQIDESEWKDHSWTPSSNSGRTALRIP